MEKITYFQGKKRSGIFDLFPIKITKKEIEDQIKKWIGFWGKKGLEIRSKRDCPIRFWSFTIKIVTTMVFWIINFLPQKIWVHFFFFPYSIQRESFTELLDRTRFLSQKYTRYYIVDICVVVLQLERLMTWIKIRRLSHLRPLLTGPSDIQTMTVPTMSVRVAQQTTAVQPSSI